MVSWPFSPPATFLSRHQVSTTRVNGPVASVAKGLMEKLERQELLAASLRQQLDELPLDDEL